MIDTKQRNKKGRRRLFYVATLLIVTTVIGCGMKPMYFDNIIPADGTATLAVLPPINFTRYDRAQDVVTNKLVVELLETKRFVVTDPGLVESVVLEKRLRLTDRLPLETMQELGEKLNVTYLMLGTISEFGFVQNGAETLPTVSISLRIIACANGRIVWAASHSKRGDDAETVFGLGRIETLDQLAGVTLHEMTSSLAR